MKLETKYGVLEGTVEEFRELLEGENFKGKVTLAYTLNPRRYKVVCEKEEAEREVVKSGYYIVKKDNVVCFLDLNKKLPKGLVLKHIKEDAYEDTLGVRYLLYDRYLDDYNGSWVDGKFKSYKDKGILLIQKEEEYKVVKEDIYSTLEGLVLLEEGTVLLETEHHLEDSLGNAYCLHPDTIENKLIEICDYSTGFHFEGNKRNHKLFKVGLPQN